VSVGQTSVLLLWNSQWNDVPCRKGMDLTKMSNVPGETRLARPHSENGRLQYFVTGSTRGEKQHRNNAGSSTLYAVRCMRGHLNFAPVEPVEPSPPVSLAGNTVPLNFGFVPSVAQRRR
jgi:hypothetical protein